MEESRSMIHSVWVTDDSLFFQRIRCKDSGTLEILLEEKEGREASYD